MAQQQPTATTYIDPAGYFLAAVGPEFANCVLSKQSLVCDGALQGPARLGLNVTPVHAAGKIDPIKTEGLAALNDRERYSDEAHFQAMPQSQTTIDQTIALSQTIQYVQLGNVQLATMLKLFYVAWGNQLLRVELNCNPKACDGYLAALTKIVGSIRLVPLDKSGKPIPGRLKPKVDVGESGQKSLEQWIKESGF